MAFGDEMQNNNSLKSFGGSPWVKAEDVDQLVSQFSNSGGEEDAFLGLAHAIGVVDVHRPDENDQIVPMTVLPQLTFRPNAAIHVIMISDEGSDTEEHHLGPEIGPAGCFDITTAEAGDPVCENNIFFELINNLRAENLPTNGPLPALSDAVFTSVAPYDFNEGGLQVTGETILGIDAHILDNVNLDKNSPDPNDPSKQDLSADVLPGIVNDNFAILTGSSTVDDVNVEVRDSANASDLLMDEDYHSAAELVLRKDLADANTEPFTRLLQSPNGASSKFAADDYAFFTWEARGTAWDFEVLRNGYENGEASIPTLVKNFNKAFIDDTFEKIRLQVADFDESGRMSLADEFNDFWAAAATLIDSDPNNDVDPRIYDLDDDGVFVGTDTTDHNSPTPWQIDQDDIKILIRIMATTGGDSNFDYEFNSSDFVVVFGQNEYEDTNEDNSSWSSGDWNGSFDFNSGDFVFAFTFASYEKGEVDEDNDGFADVIPIWAISEFLPNDSDEFNGDDTQFYLPEWGN